MVAGAAGFGFGSNSPDFPELLYLIQMSMLFAGIATLLQTVGMGPVRGRLPIVQGTSFAFIPILIPLVTGVVALMIGLYLVKDGIQDAVGAIPANDKPEYVSMLNWSAALVVILVTLVLKFFARGGAGREATW